MSHDLFKIHLCITNTHFKSLSLKGREVMKKKVSGRLLFWGSGIVSSLLRNNKGVFGIGWWIYSSVFRVEHKIYLKWNFMFFKKEKQIQESAFAFCSLEVIYFSLCREDTIFPGSDFSWCSWLLFSYNSIVMSLISHSLWILSCYLLSFTAT